MVVVVVVVVVEDAKLCVEPPEEEAYTPPHSRALVTQIIFPGTKCLACNMIIWLLEYTLTGTQFWE